MEKSILINHKAKIIPERIHSQFFLIHGFTLIELLVVISIISLLSSIVFSSVNSARVRARDARR